MSFYSESFFLTLCHLNLIIRRNTTSSTLTLTWHPMWKLISKSVWYTPIMSVRPFERGLKVTFGLYKAIIFSFASNMIILDKIWGFLASFSIFYPQISSLFFSSLHCSLYHAFAFTFFLQYWLILLYSSSEPWKIQFW